MRKLVETRGILFEADCTGDLLDQILAWYRGAEGEVTLGCIVFEVSNSEDGNDYSESATVYFE